MIQQCKSAVALKKWILQGNLKVCGLFVDEFENMSCSSVQCSLTLQSWIFDEGSQQVSNMGIGRVGTII